MTRSTKNPVTLARELLAALGEPTPENDEAPEIDEQALLERARRAADRIRRARK